MRRLATALATIILILAPVTSADAKPVKDAPTQTSRIDWD